MSEPSGTAQHSCLLAKLSHYIALTPAERRFVDGLPETERDYRRRDVILERDAPADELCVVKSGWIYGCAVNPDGSESIAELHFPGDIIGIGHVGLARSPLSYVAATEAVGCPLPKRALLSIFREHPRLVALLFALATLEHVATIDRLRAVGRMSARDSLAVFLLQVRARLRVTRNGDGGGDGFELPLSQELVGNVLGLSMVSVNRAFRQLEEEGRIRRDNRRVEFVDADRLAAEVDFSDRHYVLDKTWLPAATPDAVE